MALKTASCLIAATSKATCFGRLIPATVTYAERIPDAPVAVYDTDMNRVALLPNAFNIGYDKRINQVWSATFYLPYDDPHADECSLLRFVEIYDGSVRVGLFRITDRKVRHLASQKTWWFQCEHVLATLNDKMLVDVHNAGGDDYTEGAIEYVLARQDPVRWKLGQCDWTRSFEYRWENTTLLEALFEIPKRFGEDYQWTFSTESYPWTINLVAPSTTVTAYIDYSRNLQEIIREEDARELYTRLWAYGFGTQGSATQVSIRDVNPTGMDYIDADTIDTYGVIERVWVDQRYTDSQSLYDAAIERLNLRKTPIYRYTIKAADIYRLTGEEIDKFELGTYVQVDDEELGITTSDRVVAISKPDLQGQPGEVTIQLANKMREFTDLTDIVYSPSLDDVVDGGAFARVLSTSIEAGVIKLSAIPGGALGSLPSPPSIAGLYLSADYLGYHDGSSWKTYMDITGKFRLVGDDGYLEWDPSGTGTLTIKGTVHLSSNSTVPALFVTTAMIDDAAITTAKIDDLAVTNAKINDLSYSKITAGASNASITVGSSGYIQSSNYSAGSAGFRINGAGSAEFNDVTVRGALVAGYGSSIDGGYLSNGSITNPKIAANAVRANNLYIDDDINFAANGVYHTIYGVHTITFGGAGSYPNIGLVGGASGSDITMTGAYNCWFGANSDGTLEMVMNGSRVTFTGAGTATGHCNLSGGYIRVLIGSAVRYIKLWIDT